MKMGYSTTIVNNYQQLINLLPDLNMMLAMKNNQPQADLGNSPRSLGTQQVQSLALPKPVNASSCFFSTAAQAGLG
jgi:hypothetical protein